MAALGAERVAKKVPIMKESELLQKFIVNPDTGDVIFYPGIRPDIFVGYIVKDEETKEDILRLSAKTHKASNVTIMLSLLAVILINAVFLSYVVSFALAFLIMCLSLLIIDYFMKKYLDAKISKLEKYDGPPLWPIP